jgi:hypothetical protein
LQRQFSPNHRGGSHSSPRAGAVAAVAARRLSAPPTGSNTASAFATAKASPGRHRRSSVPSPVAAAHSRHSKSPAGRGKAGRPSSAGSAPAAVGAKGGVAGVPTFTFDEVTPGMQEITAWLADIGFGEYADGILNQGWDDLDLLRVELLSGDADRVLLDAGVLKGGHRAKIRYVAAMDSKHHGLSLTASGRVPNATALMYLGDRPATTPRSLSQSGTPRANARRTGYPLSPGGTSGPRSLRGRPPTRARTLSPEWPRAGSAAARRAARALRAGSPLSTSSCDDEDDDGDGLFARKAGVGKGRRKRKGPRRAKTPLSGRITSAKIKALAADEKRLRKFMTQYIYSPHLV